MRFCGPGWRGLLLLSHSSGLCTCVIVIDTRWASTTHRYGDDAPSEMETALRGASVVLVVITTDFLRSKFCLQELCWACDELQRRSRHPSFGQSSAVDYVLVPVFYHDQDAAMGFGIDGFDRSKLQPLLLLNHATASADERAQWLDALMTLKLRTGIRQDSNGRCSLLLRRNLNVHCTSSALRCRHRTCRCEVGTGHQTELHALKPIAATHRGDDVLVGDILASLLLLLPLSVNSKFDVQFGIAERVRWLQTEMADQDVGTVGLYGMGGIGKSTLAAAFFAEQSKLPHFQRRVHLHVGHDARDGVLQDR